MSLRGVIVSVAFGAVLLSAGCSSRNGGNDNHADSGTATGGSLGSGGVPGFGGTSGSGGTPGSGGSGGQAAGSGGQAGHAAGTGGATEGSGGQAGHGAGTGGVTGVGGGSPGGGDSSASGGGAGTASGAGGTTGGSGGAGGNGGAAAGGRGGGLGGAGGGGNVTASFKDVQLSINCMPIVAADPLNGTFTAVYENSGNVTVGVVALEGNLHFATATSSLDWTFAFTPAAVNNIAAGTMVTVQHTKTPGSGSGPGSLCDFCGTPATLAIYVEVGHTLLIETSAPMTIPCLE